MKTLGIALALLALAIVGSLAFETPTQAASGNPVVTIGNVPLPVRIVTSPATVTCTLEIGPAITPSVPFYLADGAKALSELSCPNGITRIDVYRIVYSPDVAEEITSNVSSYRATVGVGNSPSIAVANVVAIVTEGAPVAEPLQPLRLDKSQQGYIQFRVALTSGISGISPRSGGTLLLIGTQAP